MLSALNGINQKFLQTITTCPLEVEAESLLLTPSHTQSHRKQMETGEQVIRHQLIKTEIENGKERREESYRHKSRSSERRNVSQASTSKSKLSLQISPVSGVVHAKNSS